MQNLLSQKGFGSPIWQLLFFFPKKKFLAASPTSEDCPAQLGLQKWTICTNELTKLSSSKFPLRNESFSVLVCSRNVCISSVIVSGLGTSHDADAISHFSNSIAISGNIGCLCQK